MTIYGGCPSGNLPASWALLGDVLGISARGSRPNVGGVRHRMILLMAERVWLMRKGGAKKG